MSRQRLLLAAVLAASLALATPAVGGEPAAIEVELALLFNFARFTDWPEGAPGTAEATFIIGVLGGDGEDELPRQAIESRSIHGRRVQVRRLRYKDDLRVCQVLLFREMNPLELARVLKEVREEGILTVGESDDFLDQGGIIRIVTGDSTLKFEVHLGHADLARLKLHSSLLALARKVRGKRSRS